MSEPPPAPAEKSSRDPPDPRTSQETFEIQTALERLGLYADEIDGVHGPSTTEGVRAFQARIGLPVDGLAGPQTMARLREAASRVPSVDDRTSGADDREEPAEHTPTRVAPGVSAQTITFLCDDKDLDAMGHVFAALREADPDLEPRILKPEQFRDPSGERPAPGSVFVPCMSPALLGWYPQNMIGGLAFELQTLDASGVTVRLALVDRLELSSFPGLRVLADAVPFSGARDQMGWARGVASELLIALLERPSAFLPRFSADSLDGHDLLERRDKIEFLASVLSAKDLETPLAIGLFGDWGSGKSFFMRRLQQRIVDLTEASAAAVADGGPSLYCSHIRHVDFNAWLHSGSEDIWPAFAAEVFRRVADPETEEPHGDTQRDNLVAYRRRQKRKLAEATEDEARVARIRELETQIAEKRTSLQRLEPGGGPGAKLVATVRGIGRRLRHLRPRVADVAVVVAVALATLAATVWEQTFAWVLAAASALLAGLDYVGEANELRTDLRKLDDELGREQAELAAERRSKEEVVRREAPLLDLFAQEAAAEWGERAQLGSATEIRMMFEQLSDLITEGLEAQRTPGVLSSDAVPIERVVVYIDDLDRCQHDVVVTVLETLKLLLSLPQFVAVVGVDSRWLFRSLQLHFRELLHDDEDQGGPDVAWAATPQNYLEKIFQYSLVLQPMTATGFGNLIDALLTPEPIPPLDDEAPDRAPEGADGLGGDRPLSERPEAAAAVERAVPPGPDLTPAELVVTPEEIRFIKGLAPLFETPRAAKRLANVYRLMRVSVGADRLVVAESYEPVLLLLAIGIGFPGLAGETFAAIARAPEMTWPDFVSKTVGEAGRLRERADTLRDTAPVDSGRELREAQRQATAEADAYEKLADALRRASPDDVADRRLGSFSDWIPVVAEFSFHPWQELLPAATQS